jgi:NADH:ubiquinone oxidoreductase subunit 5 (subunit L)/multisubunit Na+/H+ antiporter MnhA subunit
VPNVLAAEGAGEALHLEGMSSEQVAAVLLVLGLPLAGFLLTALVGRRMGERPWIISVTAILAATAFASVLALGALTGPEPVRLGFTLYTWIPAGDLQVEVGFPSTT